MYLYCFITTELTRYFDKTVPLNKNILKKTNNVENFKDAEHIQTEREDIFLKFQKNKIKHAKKYSNLIDKVKFYFYMCNFCKLSKN